MNLSFSERQGLVPIPQDPIKENISDALRSRFWNICDKLIWEDYKNSGRSNQVVESIWAGFLNWHLDQMPNGHHDVIREIKNFFFLCEWHEVLSLVEFISKIKKNNEFNKIINIVLEKEFSAYRLIDYYIVEVYSEHEVEEINNVINNSPYANVKEHIKRSLSLLSDKKNPDFRNSIKESISAVEAICKKITNKEKATLGEALKLIKNNHTLHPAFEKAFSNLYGYTSQADGIRHSILKEPDLCMSDARYMLIICSAFINYIIDKNK